MGYAARQLNSGGQLQRLLSNPPVPLALQEQPCDWSIARLIRSSAQVAGWPPEKCAACPGDVDMSLVYYCATCCNLFCSPQCQETHIIPTDCQLDPATLVSTAVQGTALQHCIASHHSTPQYSAS